VTLSGLGETNSQVGVGSSGGVFESKNNGVLVVVIVGIQLKDSIVYFLPQILEVIGLNHSIGWVPVSLVQDMDDH